MKVLHIAALATILLFVSTTGLLFCQDKSARPNLLESAELNEANEEETAKQTPNQDRAKLQYLRDIDIPGTAEKYGMNFFPLGFDIVVFVNMRILDEEHEGFKNASAAEQGLSRIEQLLKTNRNDMDSIVRGQFAGWRPSIASCPSLLVVRSQTEFPIADIVNSSNIKKQIANGKSFYESSDGLTFAFPDNNFAVIGTRNEVVYALHKDRRKKGYPGFEWVDLSNYEAGLFRAWRQESSVSAIKLPAASFVKDDTLTESLIQASEKMAEFLAKTKRARFHMLMHATNPKQYILENPELFPAFGSKDYEGREESVNRYFEKSFESEQKMFAASSVDKEFSYEYDKNVFRGITKSLKPTTQLWYSNYYNLALSIDGVYTNQQQNDENRRQRTLQALQSFESYRFEDRTKRESLERKLLNEINVASSTLMSPLAENQFALDRTVHFLENTSSLSLRNRAIKELSTTFSARAIIALGREAHRFDLQDANRLWNADVDDAPDEAKVGYVQEIKLDDLVKRCRYYLRTANGADSNLVIACCRIIEDLRARSAQEDVKRFVERKDISEAEKAAGLRALRSIDDLSYTPPNSLPKVKDLATAQSWIRSINRARRAAALVWVHRSTDLGEAKTNIVESLMYLLDDATLHNEAMIVAKKICTQSDLPNIRRPLENAAKGTASGFRTRQDYSLHRVVDLLAHLKDREGVKLATEIKSDDLKKRRRRSNLKVLAIDDYAQSILDNWVE